MNTPWDFSQSVTEVAPGFGEVDTPGHGGIFVTPEASARLNLSPACLGFAEVFEGAYWFEEDCQSAVVLWETKPYWPAFRPHYYAPGGRGEAALQANLFKSLSRWQPDYLLDRHVVPEPAAYADHLEQLEHERRVAERDPDLIVSALHEGEHIRVWTADKREALVTAESYKRLSEANTFRLLSRCLRVETS